MIFCDWVISEYFDWAQQNVAREPQVSVQVRFPHTRFEPSFIVLYYQSQLLKPSGRNLKVGNFEFDPGPVLLPARFNGTGDLTYPGRGVSVGGKIYKPDDVVGKLNLQISCMFGRLHVNVKQSMPDRNTEFGFEPTCNPNVLIGSGNPNDPRTFCAVRFLAKQLRPR